MKFYIFLLIIILSSCNLYYKKYIDLKNNFNHFFDLNKEVITINQTKKNINKFKDIGILYQVLDIWEKNRHIFLSENFINLNIKMKNEVLLLIQFDNLYFKNLKLKQCITYSTNAIIKRGLLRNFFHEYDNHEIEELFKTYQVDSESYIKTEIELYRDFYDELNILLLLWNDI